MARTINSAGSVAETSLDSAMRAPSTTTPDVVVIDFVEEEVKYKETPSPSRDLWLSTVDGRFQSPIIPVRCGPHAEVFPVHRDILKKSEYFRRALEGNFKEAGDQAIDLPEEDPSIFSFVVAYLYEEKFVPIKPVASVLVADPDKGKGRELDDDMTASEDGTDTGSGTDNSARSRRRRRRRSQQAWEQRQRKEPGRHRPDCNCTTCVAEITGPPCWNCGTARVPPQPRPGPPLPLPPQYPPGYHHHPPRIPHQRPRARDRHRGPRPPLPPGPPAIIEELNNEARMSEEDLRTWAMAYSLSIDVYVCAERYLLTAFKTCISASIINNFEIAGLDAAIPAVLSSCRTLHDGLSPKDPLLKKIFARVGFLQARLWKNFPDETRRFFMEDVEITTAVMREMSERREEDQNVMVLPAMERHVTVVPDLMQQQYMVDVNVVPQRRPRY